MDVVNFSDTRANLNQLMDRVVADHAQVIISRQKAEAVVMISLADWNAIEESIHLLSTQANATRLMHAIAELDKDLGQ